jgi:prolyl 4-hydroxylase
LQQGADAGTSKCAQQGLAVKPKKGDALMLYNLLETGRTDGYSVHAGCPVSRGEKWTATKRILVNRRPAEQHTMLSFLARAAEHDIMAGPSRTTHEVAV